MIIHIYDFLNKNKLGQLNAEEFLDVNVTQDIDDFSTASLSYNSESKFNAVTTQGFENIYIEDDNGKIIFGGILTAYNIGDSGASITLYDHRWILTRLILETVVTLDHGESVLDVVEELITAAKAKRAIPLEFDREASAFNDEYAADLRFEIGDDIGTALQKIIQTTYSRWAVRYEKRGNEIFGRLIVRSVRGVTPEGVGIARSKHQSEDGSRVTLIYAEGGAHNNIQKFQITQDLSQMTTRSKLGAKIGGESQFFDSTLHNTDPTVFTYEFYYGRTEGFSTDYKANSESTGRTLANINQTLPRIDMEVTLSPDFDIHLNAGDRVSVIIESPLITGINGNTVRIDAVSYTLRNSHLERVLKLNFMSPQKRPGTTGLLQAISGMQQKLDGLDKNYFNN